MNVGTKGMTESSAVTGTGMASNNEERRVPKYSSVTSAVSEGNKITFARMSHLVPSPRAATVFPPASDSKGRAKPGMPAHRRRRGRDSDAGKIQRLGLAAAAR